MTTFGKSKYDYDPAAHDWARAKVEQVREKFLRFEREAKARGEDSMQWRRIINMLNMELIGGEGCVITAFDHRRARMIATMDEVETES